MGEMGWTSGASLEDPDISDRCRIGPISRVKAADEALDQRSKCGLALIALFKIVVFPHFQLAALFQIFETVRKCVALPTYIQTCHTADPSLDLFQPPSPAKRNGSSVADIHDTAS